MVQLHRFESFSRRHARVLWLALLLAAAGHLWTSAPAHAGPQAPNAVYLPRLAAPGRAAPEQPAPGSLPAAVIGTWFAGGLLPYEFYNPVTGHWAGTNGLGQMFTFAANGDYTYSAFFRSQYGQCRSEVSVYKQGQARAQATTLVLTPVTAKTRTVTVCGSRQETVTDGPFDATTLGWNVGYDEQGRVQLRVTDNSLVTDYAKVGMAAELVGGWQRGGVASKGFYNPVTQTFATPDSDGGWFRFAADGSYTMGEYGHSISEQGCALTGWVYQEGSVEVAGGRLTLTPTAGVARVENACTPGRPQQSSWVDAPRSYTFSFWDRTTEPKLVLIPLDRFQEIVFTRE